MANETHKIGESKDDEELETHEQSGDEEPMEGLIHAGKPHVAIGLESISRRSTPQASCRGNGRL